MADGNERKPLPYRLVRGTVRLLTPKYTLYGTEKLPGEPCVIVGNHSQAYGPIAAELYLPRPRRIWCVGEMMDRKEVPAYAFRDFWSGKPRRLHWLYRLFSRIIARPAAYVLSNARTIPVWRDARVVSTFRASVRSLEAGEDVVIFPECAEPYNAVLCRFQESFTDLARLYSRKAGKAPAFVPMYLAPRLKGIWFGDPVRYDPDAPAEEERKRVCEALAESITAMARALPRHTVVPYLNIPKKGYPLNTDGP